MSFVYCELCREVVQLKEFRQPLSDWLLTCNHYYYNPKVN